MYTMSLLFKKSILLALVAALIMAALPGSSANASGLVAPDEPPTDSAKNSDERLEKVWARLLAVYDRQGQKLERFDEVTERFQGRIDKLNEKGLDVSALQAALDAYVAAVGEAQPIYESALNIINSHPGFDADGKVTDSDLALETVTELAEKLKEMREIVGDQRKALREAIKALREEYRKDDNSRSQL